MDGELEVRLTRNANLDLRLFCRMICRRKHRSSRSLTIIWCMKRWSQQDMSFGRSLKSLSSIKVRSVTSTWLSQQKTRSDSNGLQPRQWSINSQPSLQVSQELENPSSFNQPCLNLKRQRNMKMFLWVSHLKLLPLRFNLQLRPT